jgi:hypothetical protein
VDINTASPHHPILRNRIKVCSPMLKTNLITPNVPSQSSAPAWSSGASPKFTFKVPVVIPASKPLCTWSSKVMSPTPIQNVIDTNMTQKGVSPGMTSVSRNSIQSTLVIPQLELNLPESEIEPVSSIQIVPTTSVVPNRPTSRLRFDSAPFISQITSIPTLSRVISAPVTSQHSSVSPPWGYRRISPTLEHNFVSPTWQYAHMDTNSRVKHSRKNSTDWVSEGTIEEITNQYLWTKIPQEPGAAERCGIIPYAKIGNGHFRILLGMKSNYHMYFGDFGGGVKRYETPLTGLIREVHEESGSVLTDNVTKYIKTAIDNPSTYMFTYKTKNRSPSLWIELMVKINYDNNLIDKFAKDVNHDKEHDYLQWIDIEKGNSNHLQMIGISNDQVCACIRPFIPGMISILETL